MPVNLQSSISWASSYIQTQMYIKQRLNQTANYLITTVHWWEHMKSSLPLVDASQTETNQLVIPWYWHAVVGQRGETTQTYIQVCKQLQLSVEFIHFPHYVFVPLRDRHLSNMIYLYIKSLMIKCNSIKALPLLNASLPEVPWFQCVLLWPLPLEESWIRSKQKLRELEFIKRKVNNAEPQK